MIKHYFEALLENTAPFMLAWEAYVLFMLLFFISIAWRLNRIEIKNEKKYNVNLEYIYHVPLFNHRIWSSFII